MSLQKQIQDALKEAMKAKDQDRMRTLRAIKSAILLAATEKGAAEELSAEKEMQLLAKQAKQRKDSAAVFQEQNREDLAEKELAELAIIEEFLPKQLSDQEVETIIARLITNTGANGMKDMGKVMGAATKEFAGKADNKVVASTVKRLLAEK
jgi:uncharacterized protein YqeY